MSSEDLEAVVNTERLLVIRAIGLAHIILMLVLGCLARDGNRRRLLRSHRRTGRRVSCCLLPGGPGGRLAFLPVRSFIRISLANHSKRKYCVRPAGASPGSRTASFALRTGLSPSN